MADDLTALRISTGCSTVLPGFPQLKLWPEAAASLGRVPAALSQLHPEFVKRACGARQGFSHRPLPLRRIYLLAEGPGPVTAPLRPQEALIGLMPHWYGFRFGDPLLQVGDAAVRHFRQCAALANSVSARAIHAVTTVRYVST